MSEELIEIARKIEAQPWNRPGSDKSWVLHAMWEHQKFLAEVQGAERIQTG